MSPRSFISLGFEGGISCARFNVQIPSVSHKLVRANAFFLFLILFYFILFFVCVNKENDTDQRALASIKLLIVVQRMAILFFGAKPRAICANHSIRQILNYKFIITIEYYDFHAISFIEKPIYYDCKFHLIVDMISYSSRELQIDAIIVSGRFVRFSLFHASISRAT